MNSANNKSVQSLCHHNSSLPRSSQTKLIPTDAKQNVGPVFLSENSTEKGCFAALTKGNCSKHQLSISLWWPINLTNSVKRYPKFCVSLLHRRSTTVSCRNSPPCHFKSPSLIPLTNLIVYQHCPVHPHS